MITVQLTDNDMELLARALTTLLNNQHPSSETAECCHNLSGRLLAHTMLAKLDD